MILSSPIWRRCTHFTQQAMKHAPSLVNDKVHYYNKPLFRLFRQGNVTQPQCLCRMVLLHTSPVVWNDCSAAISVVTESSARNFLHHGLLNPSTWILANFDCGDTSRYLFTVIPSHLYPTSKKMWNIMSETFPSSCCFQQSICDFTLLDGSREWWASYRACFVNSCRCKAI